MARTEGGSLPTQRTDTATNTTQSSRPLNVSQPSSFSSYTLPLIVHDIRGPVYDPAHKGRETRPSSGDFDFCKESLLSRKISFTNIKTGGKVMLFHSFQERLSLPGGRGMGAF